MSSTRYQHPPNPTHSGGTKKDSPNSNKLWYETGNDYNRVFRARMVDDDEVASCVDAIMTCTL